MYGTTVQSVSLAYVNTIADRIRRLLEVRGITQRELARRAGLAATQVSTLLTGLDRDPGAVQVSTLQKIARGAECSYEWLATGIELADVEPALRARRFCDLPDWPALLKDAQDAEPTLPPWVWSRVAEGRPVSEHVTAGQVAGVARLVWSFAKRPAEAEGAKG